MATEFCTNCGAAIPTGVKFCGKCGTPFSPTPGASSAPSSPASAASSDVSSHPAPRGRGLLYAIIVGVVVAVIVVASLAALGVFTSKSSGPHVLVRSGASWAVIPNSYYVPAVQFHLSKNETVTGHFTATAPGIEVIVIDSSYWGLLVNGTFTGLAYNSQNVTSAGFTVYMVAGDYVLAALNWDTTHIVTVNWTAPCQYT